MSFLRDAFALLVPSTAFVLGWRVAAVRTREWRFSLLLTTVATGCVIWLSTEALSLVHGLRPLPLTILDLTVVAAAVVTVRRDGTHGRRPPPLGLPQIGNVPLWHALWLAVCALDVMGLFVVATVAAPNNWDSMTYHLSRVAHWTQQGDIGYYATHIDRQLFSQPLAEYAILHLQVLSGSDRWANLVQWAASVICLVLLSLLARQLGLGRVGQTAAAVVALTLPMGLTEAVTTQNDYVAALWVVAMAVVVTRAEPWLGTVPDALLVGAIAGLGGATKATTYFYLAPLVVWWVLRRLRESSVALPTMAAALAISAIPLLVLTGPGFVRSSSTYGSLGGPETHEIVNEPFGPRATVENVVRHTAGQFGVPVHSLNVRLTDATRGVASGVGLQLGRPGDTFPADAQFTIGFGTREDNAQAPAATILLAVAVGFLVMRRRRRSGDPLTAGLGGVLAAATLGALLIESYFRWQPWNARFLLPFFLLTAVVSACAISQLPRAAAALVLTALSVSALLWVALADLRPLVGHSSVLTTSRTEQYFAARPELRDPYVTATDYVRSLGVVGVGYIGGLDDWEYPLWALLGRGGRAVDLQSVRVTGPTRSLERPTPSVVICTTACLAPPASGAWTAKDFGSLRVWTLGRADGTP